MTVLVSKMTTDDFSKPRPQFTAGSFTIKMGIDKEILKQIKQDFEGIGQEQIDEYYDAFRLFDTDESGKIDKNELQALMNKIAGKSYHYSLGDIERLIDAVDQNSDGEVDFYEFVLLMSKSHKSSEEELQEAFNVFDKDGDMTITCDEIMRVMKDMGHPIKNEEVKLIMDFVDLDGNQAIDFEEFKKMMSYAPPKQS